MKVSLRAARVNAGFKQKEAAEALKISNKTLCNWERAVSYPDARQIAAICKLYGVSYNDIIFLVDNPL